MNSDAISVGEQALSWLGWLFDVPRNTLKPGTQFGSDLKAGFVSDFSENQLDTVLEEVLYVRHRMREKISQSDEIRSVGEFCALVERYQAADPAGCKDPLARWHKQITRK